VPRRYADQHLLDHAAIQRVIGGEGPKRRQGDFFTVGSHPRPTNLHLPSAENDLTRDRPRARRGTHDLVLVARPTHRRPIRFEHRVEDLQAGRDRELHQLNPCVDEEIDEGQMTVAR
jgi:hypothetical protein